MMMRRFGPGPNLAKCSAAHVQSVFLKETIGSCNFFIKQVFRKENLRMPLILKIRLFDTYAKLPLDNG
jgi:hypothetical protein